LLHQIRDNKFISLNKKNIIQRSLIPHEKMKINFCDFDGFFGKYRAISANTRSTRRCIPGGLE